MLYSKVIACVNIRGVLFSVNFLFDRFSVKHIIGYCIAQAIHDRVRHIGFVPRLGGGKKRYFCCTFSSIAILRTVSSVTFISGSSSTNQSVFCAPADNTMPANNAVNTAFFIYNLFPAVSYFEHIYVFFRAEGLLLRQTAKTLRSLQVVRNCDDLYDLRIRYLKLILITSKNVSDTCNLVNCMSPIVSQTKPAGLRCKFTALFYLTSFYIEQYKLICSHSSRLI